MAIPSILQSTSKSNATSGNTAQRQTQLDTQSFLKLMTAQMANQNPLDPIKDTEYFAQLAQLGQVQSLQSMEQTMKLGQVQALIGRQVSATVDQNGVSKNVVGTVTGSSIQNGAYYLTVTDPSGNVQDVPLSGVQATSTAAGITNYSQLIGQQAKGYGVALVNGTATAVTATGQIVGITNVNGQPVARIQTTAYGVVNVSLNNLSQIGQ